nr:hypothetical protein [uncultured Draconibacterium sp.]
MKKILIFVRDALLFILFLFRSLKYGFKRSEIIKDQTGKITVLANGPSLKSDLESIVEEHNLNKKEFVVLNFFAFDNIFFELEPKYYCFADHMFFIENSHRNEEVFKLYKILNTYVDWDLEIFIPLGSFDSFVDKARFTNKHITIRKVNNTFYTGNNSFKHFFYKNGLSTPRLQTVAILAIYVALNKGFTDIDVYGIDHTFFDNLTVDNQNRLCNKERHFYSPEDSDVVLKPILRNDNNQPFTIAEYISAISEMFKSHDLLSGYSKYLNAIITNRTSKSLVDSYNRIK